MRPLVLNRSHELRGKPHSELLDGRRGNSRRSLQSPASVLLLPTRVDFTHLRDQHKSANDIKIAKHRTSYHRGGLARVDIQSDNDSWRS